MQAVLHHLKNMITGMTTGMHPMLFRLLLAHVTPASMTDPTDCRAAEDGLHELLDSSEGLERARTPAWSLTHGFPAWEMSIFRGDHLDGLRMDKRATRAPNSEQLELRAP